MEAETQQTGEQRGWRLRIRLEWPVWRTGSIRLYRNMKELLDVWRDQLAGNHVYMMAPAHEGAVLRVSVRPRGRQMVEPIWTWGFSGP